MTSEIWREVLGVVEGEGWSERAWLIPTGSQRVVDTARFYFPVGPGASFWVGRHMWRLEM